jgi:hypothetical protein
MSLKAFHLVFVVASVGLCLLMAGWSLGNYRSGGALGDLMWTVGSTLGALILLVYGRYFLVKLRNISYL